MEGTTMTKDIILLAARCAHEVNRAYCIALGDLSQLPWDDVPKWQKDSVMAGVQAIIDNPEITPEQSHEGWLKLKKEQGWRFGTVKDPDKKEHPCFIPYSQLPKEQQAKDALFQLAVRSVLEAQQC